MKKIVLLTGLTLSTLFAQLNSDMEVPYIDYKLKEAKGLDSINTNCIMCHSFGYILNQGEQSRTFWHKKVLKMVTHFKAPISKEDIEKTTNYLFQNYGNGKLK